MLISIFIGKKDYFETEKISVNKVTGQSHPSQGGIYFPTENLLVRDVEIGFRWERDQDLSLSICHAHPSDPALWAMDRQLMADDHVSVKMRAVGWAELSLRIMSSICWEPRTWQRQELCDSFNRELKKQLKNFDKYQLPAPLPKAEKSMEFQVSAEDLVFSVTYFAQKLQEE